MGPYSSDEREQIAINRLDEHARQLFFEVLNNGRKPVAMVGSGLSIIYGGVSWERSVQIALAEAKQALAAALESDPPPHGATAVRMERLKAAIEAFGEDAALSQSSDKYVALDLCEEALDLIDEQKPRPADDSGQRKPSTFREFMARVYKDDTHVVRLALAARFGFSDEDVAEFTGDERKEIDSLRKDILDNLTPSQVQQLASNIYSIPFLKTLFGMQGLTKTFSPRHAVSFHRILARRSPRETPDLAKLLGRIEADFADFCTNGWSIATPSLPVDRRGVICLFLAGLTPARRRELLKQQSEMLKKQSEPPEKPNQSGQENLRTSHRPVLDPFRALQRWLSIERYITLNFDYELEHSLMLDDIRAVYPRPRGFEEAKADRTLEREGETGGYTRRFGDGLAASTDIYHEKAVGRLFEFALGSADYSAQILHLHGRADRPESMILTDADTNRQYRRDRISRTALEQALDVTLTGNPILFVGVGLSEAEITRALRELVSRGDATIHNPAFAVMTIPNGKTAAWRQQMAFYRQYGIHLIAAGLPGLGGDQALSEHLAFLGMLEARIEYLCPKRQPGAARPVPSHAEKAAADMLLRKIGEAGKSLGLLRSPEEDPVTHLKIDWAGFEHLVNVVCAASRGRVGRHTKASWLDYIDKIRAKLFSLTTIETLRSLRDGFIEYRKERVIPADIPGKMVERARDDAIWNAAVTPQTGRHICLIQNGAGAPWALAAAGAINADTAGVVAYFAPLGSGKGTIVRCLGECFSQDGRPSLIVNCNLSIEFDSVLSIILTFLGSILDLPAGQDISRIDRLETMQFLLRSYPLKVPGTRPVLVLAGLERLIDSSGRPVSTELDMLLTLLFRFDLETMGLQLVLVAANGCRRYVEDLMRHVRKNTVLPLSPAIPAPAPAEQVAIERGLLGHVLARAYGVIARTGPVRWNLKLKLDEASKASTQAYLPNSPRSPAVTEVLRIVLERWHELAFDAPSPGPLDRLRAELDKEILGQLAFVGMPTETAFLGHLLPVRKLVGEILAFPDPHPAPGAVRLAALDREIQGAVGRLLDFGLIVRVSTLANDDTPANRRYALHRSVLAEVRERFGVRSGDELLSNSFSPTLASSMPTDLVVADWDVHLRMKNTVGRLRGAWKDAELPESINAALREIREGLVGSDAAMFDSAKQPFDEIVSQLARAACHADMPMHVSIRAAAGVIRGFFCAASLVALLPETMQRDGGTLGEFEEHKRRIGNILNRLRETAQLSEQVDRIEARLDPKSAKVAAIRPQIDSVKSFIKDSRPIGPLYGTEIVWLLNEQAVIALLQGSLHEAQKGFADALAANRLFRSRNAGQAWRRIEINRSLLLVETGHIREARVALEKVRSTLAEASIRSQQEIETIDPLIDTYLALCEHLGGNYSRADDIYEGVIARLTSGGQQRALALAQMRRATLLFTIGNFEDGKKAIGLGVAAAEAGRQMDVLWRARLTEITVLDHAADRKRIERTIKAARLYARKMEFPRLEIQSLRTQAKVRLEVGDYEAASAAAAEAMTIATRCGMTLQSIALRVVMGKILLQRGDRSGYYLLERAVSHADRIGYQLQVDHAQQAMLDANYRLD